ncbi:MAG: C39 family peptidase [Deltaproteobacteria bacterium]|nr:C39 family peptidase [Deltaproteobacteria bacterium]
MEQQFSLIPQPQEDGHCGPTSLSSCLAILGIHAEQREIARAVGRPQRVYSEGMDERDIRRGARKFGVRTEFLSRLERGKGPGFARRLKGHLRQGLPAILLVQDFSHWVAVIGRLEEREQFIIMDPDDRHRAFSRWSEHTLLREAWNGHPHGYEPDQYFAILTSRKDGRPPRWRITESFLRLVDAGSEQTSDEMLNDLIEMARRARADQADDEQGPSLNEVLEEHERVVIGSVEHWAAFNRRSVKPAALRSLYRDYTVIASAAGLRLPRAADTAAIVAQMATVLTTYAWLGKL